MVRATTARVLIRLGGSYPAGFDATSVGNLCTQADYILDGHTDPQTLSTSDNEVIEVCCDIVLNMMAEASWFQAGGYLSGRPKPVILSDDLKQRIHMLSGETYGIITAVDTIED